MTTVWYSITRGAPPGSSRALGYRFTWAAWDSLPFLDPIDTPSAFGGAAVHADVLELIRRGRMHDTHYERIDARWGRAWQAALRERREGPAPDLSASLRKVTASIDAMSASRFERPREPNPLHTITLAFLADLGVDAVKP